MSCSGLGLGLLRPSDGHSLGSSGCVSVRLAVRVVVSFLDSLVSSSCVRYSCGVSLSLCVIVLLGVLAMYTRSQLALNSNNVFILYI